MVKKISFLILSVAILVIGIIAFRKLGYWDRSVRIFKYSSNTPFEGRMGRGQEGREFEGRERPGGGEGFVRPEMRELPDSIRARFETREGRPGQGMRERNIPDSLRQQFGPRNGERTERGPVEGGIRNGEGRGRGEFPGGKKVNIRNVKWFLAVFAAFTVIAIYIDKAVCLIRRRKRGRKYVLKGIIIVKNLYLRNGKQGKKIVPRYYMRIYHRNLGFFILGFVMIYALAKCASIYRDTDFMKHEKTIKTKLPAETKVAGSIWTGSQNKGF